MPWVKLTDDWYDDPAIASLDDHGIALWVLGLTWCARNLTDGEIPAAMVRRLSSHEDPPSVAASLVELDLWTAGDGCYVVSNYHQYQPTRAEVLAKREKDRQRKADSRSGTGPSGVQADSEENPGPPGPVPGPGSDPVVVSGVLHYDGPQAVDDGDEVSVVLAECWDQIARWKADEKGKPGHAGFIRACKRNQPTDPHPEGGTFLEQARKTLAGFTVKDGKELAEVLTGRRRLTLADRKAS